MARRGLSAATLGPPMRGSSSPETASRASRTSSASSRRRLACQSRRFSGSSSRAWAEGATTEALAVGGGAEEQAVHGLEASGPAARKAAGQPVEQLGVAGGFAQAPVVAGGGDQAAPEVVLPEAVDDRRGSRAGFPGRKASGRG